MSLPQPWTPPQPTVPPRTVHLTPQRLRVLDAVCRCRTNQQTAHELGVALDTVKAHVKTLLSLLGAINRTHLVALVYSEQVRIVHTVNTWERKAS